MTYPSADPIGIAAKKTEKTRPRSRRGNASASRLGAIDPYAASPMPSVARATNSVMKLTAKPPSTVATLQMATPRAISRGR